MSQDLNQTRPIGGHADKIGELFVMCVDRPGPIRWNSSDLLDDAWYPEDVVMYLGDNMFWWIKGNYLREVYSKLEPWDDWFSPWKPTCTTSQKSG